MYIVDQSIPACLKLQHTVCTLVNIKCSLPSLPLPPSPTLSHPCPSRTVPISSVLQLSQTPGSMSSLSLPPPFILPLLLVALSPLFSPASGTNYRAGGCDGSTDRAKLYVQGFVPASGEVFTSETVVPATTVACQEINGNASILSDYELVIEWSDTMVTNKYAKKLASISYIYMYM